MMLGARGHHGDGVRGRNPGAGPDPGTVQDVGTRTLLAYGRHGTRDLVMRSGQVYRLITAVFVHGSITHVALNLLVLLVSGWMLEGLVGPLWLLAVFGLGQPRRLGGLGRDQRRRSDRGRSLGSDPGAQRRPSGRDPAGSTRPPPRLAAGLADRDRVPGFGSDPAAARHHRGRSRRSYRGAPWPGSCWAASSWRAGGRIVRPRRAGSRRQRRPAP